MQPNSRQPNRPLIALLLLIALVLVGALGLYLYTRAQATLTDLNEQLGSFATLENVAGTLLEYDGAEAADSIRALPGVTLPADAEDIWFARQGSSEAVYWLRFTVPPDSLSTALSAACFNTLEDGYSPPFEYAANPDIIANLDWWTPDEAQTYTGGQCVLRENVTFNLLVDHTTPAHATLYWEIITE